MTAVCDDSTVEKYFSHKNLTVTVIYAAIYRICNYLSVYQITAERRMSFIVNIHYDTDAFPFLDKRFVILLLNNAFIFHDLYFL